MSGKIRLTGATSGFVELAAPDVADGSTVILGQPVLAFYVRIPTSFASASTTYVDITGAAITLTPRSSTSRFLIRAISPNWTNSAAATTGWLRIVRNAGVATSHEAMNSQSGAGYNNNSTLEWLDAPGSIDPVTYAIQMKANGGTQTHYDTTLSILEVPA